MTRIALGLVDDKSAWHKPGYVPVFPRARAKRFVHEIEKAESMMDASRIAKWWSKHLPAESDWAFHMGRLAESFRTGRPGFNFFILDGNVKLPFACWSTLPITTCPGCGPCAEWCYSLTSWHWAGPFFRQISNTLFLKFRPHLVADAWFKLPQDLTIRLYVDGDFDSLSTVAFWMALIRQRPDLKVYGYSKSWDELWAYHEISRGAWPKNYVLNLSSGGKVRGVTESMMRSLPIVRGKFISLDIDYHPKKTGNVGHERFDDPEYHRAVREAGARMGLKVFSCPGKCGSCNVHGHVCGGGPTKEDGSRKFDGITVAIGIH